MPEPKEVSEEKQEEAVETKEEVKTDAFGMGENPEPKKEEKKEEKKGDTIPEDHPTVVSLKEQIQKISSDKEGMSANLTAQRELIKSLQDKVDQLTTKGGDNTKDGEVDVLYKDIKWSKDLTDEEKEEMTETEIRQMDEIAEMKTKQNELYAESQKKNKEQESKKSDDIQSLVKSTALELSKDEDGKESVELANQIIESTKQFNLEGLDDKTIIERVGMARKLLPDYTPPKETVTKKGKTVKGTSTDEDPFGVDTIIDEVSEGSDGNYAL